VQRPVRAQPRGVARVERTSRDARHHVASVGDAAPARELAVAEVQGEVHVVVQQGLVPVHLVAHVEPGGAAHHHRRAEQRPVRQGGPDHEVVRADVEGREQAFDTDGRVVEAGVRADGEHVRLVDEGADEVGDPGAGQDAVGVDPTDQVGGCGGARLGPHPGGGVVARARGRGDADLGLGDDPGAVPQGHLDGVVGAAVVDDDHLVGHAGLPRQ
jgi:hypothetical protein